MIWINDPFCRQLEVYTDEEYATRYISYALLAAPATSQPQQISSQSEGEDEPAAQPAPRLSVKSPKIKAEKPQVELGSRIQCDEDEIVPLLYVPCLNGVLKAGSVVVYFGMECSVTKLQFEGTRKKVLVILVNNQMYQRYHKASF